MNNPRFILAGLLSAVAVTLASHGTAIAAPPVGPPAVAPPVGPPAGPPVAGAPGGPPAAGPGASAPGVGMPDQDPAILSPSDPGPPDAVPPDPGPISRAVLAPGAAPKELGDLAAFFGSTLSWIDHGTFGLDRARLLQDRTAPTGRLIRVNYPAGSASPTAARGGARDGGAQAYLRLPRSADNMTLIYYVRFQPGFQFVKGGKLPGLFGGDAGSGGRHEAAGFTTRFMWRAGGAGEVYAYLPTDKGYGASLGRGRWRFTTGNWIRIAQRVVLNTPGHNNGTVTVWMNGRTVFSQGGLNYRTTDQVHVDGLFFSTFFGGSDKSWASPTNQYADFSAFSFTPGGPPARRGP
jgi:hypothetical protein